MKKLTSEAMTRCELALMGRVVKCTTDEVIGMTKYILSAIGKDPDTVTDDFVKRTIKKYSDTNEVKYIVTNTVEGMKCITYLLESTSEDEEEAFPAPFTENYGTRYPCAFCYVYNTDVDYYSEFGDCFFTKRSEGYYHRVS